MTLEEIKKALEALGPTERREVLAFLVRRRLLDDPSYRAEVDRRSADSDPNHWLKPEDFEQRLEDLLRARMAQAKTGDMSPQSVSDIWAEVRATATKPGNEVMEAAAKSGSTDQYGKVIASPQALKSDFSTSTMP